MDKIDIKSMDLNELKECFVSLGIQKYRASQVFDWLLKGVKSFDEMLNVPKDLKIIFEGFEVVCDEYAGAKTIDEIYLPIYEKYKHLFMEEC